MFARCLSTTAQKESVLGPVPPGTVAVSTSLPTTVPWLGWLGQLPASCVLGPNKSWLRWDLLVSTRELPVLLLQRSFRLSASPTYLDHSLIARARPFLTSLYCGIHRSLYIPNTIQQDQHNRYNADHARSPHFGHGRPRPSPSRNRPIRRSSTRMCQDLAW